MTFVCNAGPVIALAKIDHLLQESKATGFPMNWSKSPESSLMNEDIGILSSEFYRCGQWPA